MHFFHQEEIPLGVGPVIHAQIPLMQNIMPLCWPICARRRPHNATNNSKCFLVQNNIYVWHPQNFEQRKNTRNWQMQKKRAKNQRSWPLPAKQVGNIQWYCCCLFLHHICGNAKPCGRSRPGLRSPRRPSFYWLRFFSEYIQTYTSHTLRLADHGSSVLAALSRRWSGRGYLAVTGSPKHCRHGREA